MKVMLTIDPIRSDETLLLDLLNTTSTTAGSTVDRLADSAAATTWVHEHRGEASTEEDVAHLRATRDALQAVIRKERRVDALEFALEGVAFQGAATPDGIAWTVAAPRTRQLATKALIAWDALERATPGRVRPCDNTDECTRFLIDHSKSNTARWCSMAECGNRMKARRHRQRQVSGRW